MRLFFQPVHFVLHVRVRLLFVCSLLCSADYFTACCRRRLQTIIITLIIRQQSIYIYLYIIPVRVYYTRYINNIGYRYKNIRIILDHTYVQRINYILIILMVNMRLLIIIWKRREDNMSCDYEHYSYVVVILFYHNAGIFPCCCVRIPNSCHISMLYHARSSEEPHNNVTYYKKSIHYANYLWFSD